MTKDQSPPAAQGVAAYHLSGWDIPLLGQGSGIVRNPSHIWTLWIQQPELVMDYLRLKSLANVPTVVVGFFTPTAPSLSNDRIIPNPCVGQNNIIKSLNSLGCFIHLHASMLLAPSGALVFIMVY